MFEFTCNQCKTKFNIKSSIIVSMSSFKCPVCSNKISQRTFSKLVSDYTQYTSYDDFTVHFISANDIDFKNILVEANEKARKGTLAVFDKDLTLEALEELLEQNNVLHTYFECFSLSLISAYHLSLQRNFKKIGVETGNLVL